MGQHSNRCRYFAEITDANNGTRVKAWNGTIGSGGRMQVALQRTKVLLRWVVRYFPYVNQTASKERGRPKGYSNVKIPYPRI